MHLPWILKLAPSFDVCNDCGCGVWGRVFLHLGELERTHSLLLKSIKKILKFTLNCPINLLMNFPKSRKDPPNDSFNLGSKFIIVKNNWGSLHFSFKIWNAQWKALHNSTEKMITHSLTQQQPRNCSDF